MADKDKVTLKIKKQELNQVDIGIKKDGKPVLFDIEIEKDEEVSFKKLEKNEESIDTIPIKWHVHGATTDEEKKFKDANVKVLYKGG